MNDDDSSLEEKKIIEVDDNDEFEKL